MGDVCGKAAMVGEVEGDLSRRTLSEVLEDATGVRKKGARAARSWATERWAIERVETRW